MALWLWVSLVMPLSVLPLESGGASPRPMVYPDQGNGFASYIIGGFVGLGVLVLFARWTSRRPRRPS